MCSCTSAPQRSGMRSLRDGQKVSYDVEADRRTGKGPRPTSGPHNAKAPPERKAQSVKGVTARFVQNCTLSGGGRLEASMDRLGVIRSGFGVVASAASHSTAPGVWCHAGPHSVM